MKTLFTRNGDKLVFDHVSDGEIYGRILLSDGRIFEPQNIDAILARGYWVQEPDVSLMDFLPKEIKSVSLKYSPDQLRDENGRFSIDGAGGSYERGQWKKVPVEALVEADVQKAIKENPDLTEKEIASLQRKATTFHSKNLVMKNGSTIVYAPKPTRQSERAGYSQEYFKEKFVQTMKQIDNLQEHAPLENISVRINPGSQGNTMAWAEKAGEGTTIQLNTGGMVQAQLGRAFAEIKADRDGVTLTNNMPTDNKDTLQEFALAHEWGHAVDNASGKHNRDEVYNLLTAETRAGLSEYSKESPAELYAELFAQHYFEAVHGAPPILATEVVKELLK